MDFERKYDRRPSSAATLPEETLVEAAGRLNGSPLRTSTRLSGGFCNTNVLLEFANGDRCVLRVSAEPQRLEMEADLLAHLPADAPAVPVPEVLWRSPGPLPGGVAAFAMSYIDGRPLASVEDALSAPDRRDICEQLAVAAAAVHDVRFPRNGLLGPGLAIAEPFASYVDGAIGFLDTCLDDPRLQDRIGPGRLARLRRCVSDRRDLHEPSLTGQLCHGDFNQKNLLVRKASGGRCRLAAVIDWEFALSASGVMDIGNLLRFERESPAVDGNRFADAYRGAGGRLDQAWRQQSLFADLLAQCAFLVDTDDHPRTFATAIAVIDRSLAVLLP